MAKITRRWGNLRFSTEIADYLRNDRPMIAMGH